MTKHTGAMTDGRMFVVEGEYRGRKMVQRDGVHPEEERQKKNGDRLMAAHTDT